MKKKNELNEIFKSSIIENSKMKSIIKGGVQITALNSPGGTGGSTSSCSGVSSCAHGEGPLAANDTRSTSKYTK